MKKQKIKHWFVIVDGRFASTRMLQKLHKFIAFWNKKVLFVKIESLNFQHLYDSEFRETSINFSFLCWQTKSFVPKKVIWVAQFHCNWIAVFPLQMIICINVQGAWREPPVRKLGSLQLEWRVYVIWSIKFLSSIESFVEEKTAIQLQFNCAILVTLLETLVTNIPAISSIP